MMAMLFQVWVRDPISADVDAETVVGHARHHSGYLTDGVNLYRFVGEIRSGIGHLIALEDCWTLAVFLLTFDDLRASRLRAVFLEGAKQRAAMVVGVENLHSQVRERVRVQGGRRGHAAGGLFVVALPGCHRFVSGLSNGFFTRAVVRAFPDGELHTDVPQQVEERRCVIVGSISPPAGNFERLTLVAHALRRAGAERITALLPYLAYARQDRAARTESLGLAWAGGLLRASGVDEVVWARKRRTAGGVEHLGLVGHPGRRAIVVDDILDTGDTLVSCCRALRDAGVRDLRVIVTHGLFTGTRGRALLSEGVGQIWISDTVLSRRRPPRACVLPVAPPLAPVLEEVVSEEGSDA